jgi:hypothetical protein
MKKTTMRASVVVAAMVASGGLALGLGAGRASANHDEDGRGRLAGTWRVSVTTRDCASGAPLISFPAMLTFNDGGTMTGTTASRAFAPGQRSGDHGVWGQARGSGYRAVSEAFILFDTAGAPPVPPLQRGVQRLTQAITVDGDAFDSNAWTKFFDAAGNEVASGCATATARRMK